MPTSVILVTSYDPGYLEIFMHLVRSEVAAGNTALAFDISPLLAAPVDTYHRGVLRAFGRPFPGHDLGERVARAGGEYVLAATAGGARGADAEAAPLDDPRLEAELQVAVRSAVITFSRTDRPVARARATRRLEHGLTREGRVVYRRVRELCTSHPDISLAFVPNGRVAHQRLALMAFQDAGVATRHIEKGQVAGRAYVQDYSPHDRFRSQGAIDGVLAGLTDAEVDAIADGWLAQRAPAPGSRNEYSTLWNTELDAAVAARREQGGKIATFFTSSQDEFLFQGLEWQVHDWADQFTAFDAIMTRLEADGFACVLRVHPNLATRAHDYFRRERDGIRRLAAAHPDLIVIWHDDRANSYALIEASSAVVIFASTVGVEASARGVPVWAAAATQFGEVADIREVFSAEALAADDLQPWTVDPRGAKRFIAYLVRRDVDVAGDGESWTWWTGRRPVSASLAAIAVSGGTPGVGAAVLSLIDVYRHRSLGASARARRRR